MSLVIFSFLSVDELFDNDSVEHSEHDHLATDGSREPSSREFEKHYDMLHDIEQEKDIYRLRVRIQYPATFHLQNIEKQDINVVLITGSSSMQRCSCYQ